jgi:hypothetical protein
MARVLVLLLVLKFYDKHLLKRQQVFKQIMRGNQCDADKQTKQYQMQKKRCSRMPAGILLFAGTIIKLQMP